MWFLLVSLPRVTVTVVPPARGCEAMSSARADAGGPLAHARSCHTNPAAGAAWRTHAVVDDASSAPSPSQSPTDVSRVDSGVALGVDDRLLGDPPQLALLEEGQPARGLVLVSSTSMLAALAHTVEEVPACVAPRSCVSATSVRRS